MSQKALVNVGHYISVAEVGGIQSLLPAGGLLFPCAKSMQRRSGRIAEDWVSNALQRKIYHVVNLFECNAANKTAQRT
jgi:hypothetical protein